MNRQKKFHDIEMMYIFKLFFLLSDTMHGKLSALINPDMLAATENMTLPSSILSKLNKYLTILISLQTAMIFEYWKHCSSDHVGFVSP